MAADAIAWQHVPGFDPDRCLTHTVNMDNPELNGKFKPVHFFNAVEEYTLVNGVELIQRFVELADVRNGRHRAYLSQAQPNCVLVRDVAVPHSERVEYEQNYLPVIESLTRAYREEIQRAETALRVQCLADEERTVMWYKLVFPNDMHFSNSVFSPRSNNGLINIVPVPWEGQTQEVGGVPYTITHTRVMWRVNLDGAQRALQVAQRPTNVAEDVLNGLFNGRNRGGAA